MTRHHDTPENKPPQIIIYETDDKIAKVSVRLDGETVWLTQQQLADLYGTSRPNVTMHIRKIFSDAELLESAVCKKFLQTATDGKNYEVLYYNLDMIISLGYRINRERRNDLSPVFPDGRRHLARRSHLLQRMLLSFPVIATSIEH
ncbi:MAG: hypothetical protein LBG61_03665 [Burkholderiales bacterium]|jgi:hypothetical protein|nr:hypothetical protein [Burkholderiales bacterium]